MTAPRMTDEAWRDLGERDVTDRLDATAAYGEAWQEGDRARRSEAALLARVKRLEEALREFDGAFTDLDPEDHTSRTRMRVALIKARTALSEKP